VLHRLTHELGPALRVPAYVKAAVALGARATLSTLCAVLLGVLPTPCAAWAAPRSARLVLCATRSVPLGIRATLLGIRATLRTALPTMRTVCSVLRDTRIAHAGSVVEKIVVSG